MNARAYVGELREDFRSRIQAYRPRRKGIVRKAFHQLADALLKRADEHTLVELAPDAWLAQVEHLLFVMGSRNTGEVRVDIHGIDATENERARTLVSTCMSDQPFIVDTMRLLFEQQGLAIHSQTNVILPVLRSRSGKLRGIDWEGEEHRLESVTLFELPPIEGKRQRDQLAQAITGRLLQSRAMFKDFHRMLHEVKGLVNEYEFLEAGTSLPVEELREIGAFLRWLLDENFVFMGLSFQPTTKSGGDGYRFGVFRFREGGVTPPDHEGRQFLRDRKKLSRLVLVHKTSEESEVHRSGKIDEILVHKFDDRGRLVGNVIIHGLFTFRAVHAQGSLVPLLRQKLARVVADEEVVEGSYNFKGVVNGFDSLPVEYLFTASPADIRALVRRTLAAERSLRVEVHLSLNLPQHRGFLFVVMPRQHFGDDVRARIQEHLEAQLGINYCDHRVFIGNYGMAVLHFYFTSGERFPDLDAAQFETEILGVARSWQDRFRDALLRALPREQAFALYRIYSSAFSERYQVSTDGAQAVEDCLQLEGVRESGGLGFGLYRDAEDEEGGTAKLRIYEATNLFLSDVLPILDNFGLTVVNSFANRARPAGAAILYMDTFRFEIPDGDLDALLRMREALLAALAEVFEGRIANDRLNRILLPAGLSSRQVDLIRSYQGYSRQLGNMFTPTSIWRALAAHAGLVRQWVEWFEAKFGPDAKGGLPSRPTAARRRRAEALREEVYRGIDRIESFNEDRILRTFANLVDATLRTSYFAQREQLAHKIDCAQVFSMSEPRPWREIYVHHATVEGVHLRGGKVARGGLRWSDRPEDYRTEILGLMSTQMVKNVVIVPLGAKGGFVLRRAPSDPAERRAFADAMYRVFINGLLDLSDNIVDGTTVPPRGVVCYDDEDPYLVVAADKGTAHLSDTANSISEERGFWLGDAFASGGSNGYDHKAVGITARGAWVSIRHLFGEMGIDPDRDAFSVVGIGDMGGDVFGNGLIEHKMIRLKAAFNHLHIFLDPDPDPRVSYAERKRLFKAKQGGWDQYDLTKISRGGGIFARESKSIPLSAPARKMLGVEEAKLSPNDVIRAILRMEVDLLYNGGIGTYVKASTEEHTAAQDPGNDNLRVNADELRARVIGEGGNLGLTTRARIEYARAGGRINTDFIDNAGGVNMSDHEVNLKILFRTAADRGKLGRPARNKLLRELEPIITEDVLGANGSQALMLSLDEERSRLALAPFDRVVDDVCRRYGRTRVALGLPTVKQIDARIGEGEGLSRPELAVLSSYVKMMVYHDLVEDGSVDMEGLRPYLHNYFPERVKRRYASEIDEHRLGREIALTRLTNRIVDQAGATFFNEMAFDADASVKEAVEAYSLVSRAAGLWALKDEILALPKLRSQAGRYGALLQLETSLRAASLHILERWSPASIRETLRDTTAYGRRIRGLADSLLDCLDPVSLQTAGAVQSGLRVEGFPDALARRVATMRYLPYALTVLDLAARVGAPARSVARDYFALGRESCLFEAVERLDAHKAEGYYESLALRVLRRDLLGLASRLVLRLGKLPGSASSKLDTLGKGRRALAMLQEIGPEDLGPASLLVASERIKSVLR